MRPWLQALVLLSVAVAFGVSLALLSTVIGITSPWLALLLMFDFLGICKFAEPLFALRMPSGLYRIRAWEQERGFLRRIGVRRFGKLLRHSPLRHANKAVYLDRQHGDLAKVRRHIEASEAAHFWATVLFMPFIALLALNGQWSFVALFCVVQVLVNIYPILHLRIVRQRMERHIHRQHFDTKLPV